MAEFDWDSLKDKLSDLEDNDSEAPTSDAEIANDGDAPEVASIDAAKDDSEPAADETAPDASTPTPVPPQAAPSVNPLVSQYLSKLKSAQAETKSNRFATGMTSALVQLGHAFSHATNPVDLSAVNEMSKSDDAPVKDLLQQHETARDAAKDAKNINDEDPNSPTANRLRQIYAPMFQKSGLDPASLDGLSANDIKAYAQNPLEFQYKQQSLAANKQASIDANRDKFALAKADQASKQENSAYDHTNAQLLSMRGDSEATKASGRLGNIKTAQALIDQYPNPDDMPPAQVNLLMDELGQLATGGSPSEGVLHQLAPNTLAMQASAFKNKIMNGTSGANAGAFIKEAGKYVKDQATTQQQILNDRNSRVIDSSRISPESKASLRQIHNRASMYPDAPATPSAPGAQPSSKPTTVIQNGHAYTLNPATGKYE